MHNDGNSKRIFSVHFTISFAFVTDGAFLILRMFCLYLDLTNLITFQSPRLKGMPLSFKIHLLWASVEFNIKVLQVSFARSPPFFMFIFPFKIQIKPDNHIFYVSLCQGVKRKQALLGSNLSAIRP